MSADQLAVPPADAARRLLGSVVWSGPVGVRIVEVEAYGGDPAGPWPDPASHSGRGPTRRNAVMFGPAGVLYVYLSYGTHFCVNVTSGPDGVASAVLLRSGEVVAGLDTARARRPTARRDHDLARGPGNFGSTMGITLADYGTELFDRSAHVHLALHEPIAPERIASGPRVGVSFAADVAWRFWLPESPAVSVYRRSPRAPRPTT
ncbi:MULTISPECIES: DNA-3-methyladenine glycosylase [Nocardia]|uniref:DNA-3-methyladenine glycosylase n=1 Tax=Nocardia TaxID=1817 RepID=UPI000D686B92|nr:MULTISPECIES: DNA-3-methyladenine glycosylase [Nocardia]